jgi:hypothetical protein
MRPVHVTMLLLLMSLDKSLSKLQSVMVDPPPFTNESPPPLRSA